MLTHWEYFVLALHRKENRHQILAKCQKKKKIHISFPKLTICLFYIHFVSIFFFYHYPKTAFFHCGGPTSAISHIYASVHFNSGIVFDQFVVKFQVFI